MKFNLHTHTYRCKHAKGKDEDYVLKAIETKMEVLGFSDHIPFKHDQNSKIRMSYLELNDYLNSIESLKVKYQDQIKIYVGFESEYIEEEYDFYEQISKQVDYLILGPHFYKDIIHPSSRICEKEDYHRYVKMIEKAIHSHLFTYIAHPDIFLCNTKELNDDIILCIHQIAKLAKENNVILEYNIEGLRDHLRGRIWPNGTTTGYPRKEFWEIIASYHIPVILGSDVHDPANLNDEATKLAYQNCKELHLDLIDHLDLNDYKDSLKK